MAEVISLSKHPNAIQAWEQAYATAKPPRPTHAIHHGDAYVPLVRSEADQLAEQQRIWDDTIGGLAQPTPDQIAMFFQAIRDSEGDEYPIGVHDSQMQAEEDFRKIAIQGYGDGSAAKPAPVTANFLTDPAGFFAQTEAAAKASAIAGAGFQDEQTAIAAGAFTDAGPGIGKLGQIGPDKALSDKANAAWEQSDPHRQNYAQTVGQIQAAGLQVTEQAEAARADLVGAEYQELKKSGIQKVGDWIAANTLTGLAILGTVVGGVLTGGAIAIAAGCALAVAKATSAAVAADTKSKQQAASSQDKAAKVAAMYAYQRQCYDALQEALPKVQAYDESQRVIWVTQWIAAHGGSTAAPAAGPPQAAAPAPSPILRQKAPIGILGAVGAEVVKLESDVARIL